MMAEIEDGRVMVYDRKTVNRLSLRGYGALMDERYLELHPVEALYLVEERKLRVKENGEVLDEEGLFSRFASIDSRFEQRFVVYRDLRKRGYKINCFHELREKGLDYYLKPKREDQKDIFAVSINEREEFNIKDVLSYLRSLDPLIEELWMAVVDEEGDITYYKVYEVKPKGNLKDVENIRCRGSLLKHLVIVKEREVGKELSRQAFYGNLTDSGLTLSLIEALHLLDREVLDVYSRDEKIDREDIIKIARSFQRDFEIRYKVYKDLKEKGLCVKTGYKFGTHFRAYERDPNRYHAEYLIDAVTDSFKSSWSNISRGVRLAHSVRKLYVLAVLSEKIRYVGMERIRP